MRIHRLNPSDSFLQYPLHECVRGKVVGHFPRRRKNTNTGRKLQIRGTSYGCLESLPCDAYEAAACFWLVSLCSILDYGMYSRACKDMWWIAISLFLLCIAEVNILEPVFPLSSSDLQFKSHHLTDPSKFEWFTIFNVCRSCCLPLLNDYSNSLSVRVGIRLWDCWPQSWPSNGLSFVLLYISGTHSSLE